MSMSYCNVFITTCALSTEFTRVIYTCSLTRARRVNPGVKISFIKSVYSQVGLNMYSVQLENIQV